MNLETTRKRMTQAEESVREAQDNIRSATVRLVEVAARPFRTQDELEDAVQDLRSAQSLRHNAEQEADLARSRFHQAMRGDL